MSGRSFLGITIVLGGGGGSVANDTSLIVLFIVYNAAPNLG